MMELQGFWAGGERHSLNPIPESRKYDVFINHRGKDAKNTVASLVYHNLRNRNLHVFLDREAIQRGHDIPLAITHAIRTSSVHIVIFSRHYAESKWCLAELCLMVDSGAPIVPVFWGVRPRDLHIEGGVYPKYLQKHLSSGRVDTQTVTRWKTALIKVSSTYSFQFQGDQGMLLENISSCVMEKIQAKRQFQRGLMEEQITASSAKGMSMQRFRPLNLAMMDGAWLF